MAFKDDRKIISISRPLLLTLVLGALSLGIFLGTGLVSVFAPFQGDKSEDSTTKNREGEFRFIRTVPEPKGSEHRRSNRELKPFRYKVNALIEEKIKRREATSISVYFRDLNDGNRFGIGEREKFSPKSVLKTPLMIAYFKWSETNPLVLRKTLIYTGKERGVEQENERPGKELQPGKAYSVNDLIYRMIVYDDAAAYALLYANLPEDRLDRIFKDLYVEYDPHKQEDALTLDAFAAFFRVLFNASYLSEEMSEKALRYLSRSTFRDGMASGVPPAIDIASKHGERTIEILVNGEEQEGYQLHEFGIIYHPNRPFLLGIMARGQDFGQLVKTIRDITRLVYEEVDQQS